MSKNEYEIGQTKFRDHGPGPGGPPPHMRMAEKPKDFKGGWKKILAYARKYIPIMIIAGICAICGVVASLIGPKVLEKITNAITAGFAGIYNGKGWSLDVGLINGLCVTLLLIYAGGAVLNGIQGYSMAVVSQKLSNSFRRSISEKINRLPLKYFDTISYGNIMSRITNDVDTLSMSLNQSLGQLVTSVTTLIGALIMMFVTNWILAAVAIFSTLFGFVFVRKILSHTQKYFQANQRLLGEINGHIEETYAGHNIVKAFNGEKIAKATFKEINDKLYYSNWKSQFLSGLMMPLMNFIGNFGYVAVCVVGALLAKNGSIEFGVIVAFIVYVRMFTHPLQQIAQVATTLQSTAAAGERVFEFLDETDMEDESGKTTKLADVKGDVSFDHVKFGYDPGKTIIKDFSVDIKAGQKVAIVGPTGAGKTTIVNLLMRFYETESGGICIDGVPTSELTRENVHDLFCMVLQDTWLFEGTIKENIIYSKKGVTDEEVKNACKAVGLHHFIRTLPHSYDTVLNEAASLSAGQKQLLTIARAMIENAPLLILDEATSSVDTRTEVLVQRAMDQLMKGRTSFVIAHRLSTIRNADIILVMKDGDIIESGSHDELIRKGGFYAELYNSQFEQAS
jgi:ATP-binding cassette subfamily B multidrug efflux pump